MNLGILAGSVAGPKHIENNESSDDAFSWIVLPDGSRIIAIADGAGSQHGTAAIGAWAATQYLTSPEVAAELVKNLQQQSDNSGIEATLFAAFKSTKKHVRGLANELSIPERKLATTLALAVMVPDHCYIASIGDSIIAVQDSNGVARTILIEDKFGGPANETTFLHHLESHPERFRWCDAETTGAVALCSDGIRDQLTILAENYKAYPGAFERLWELTRNASISRADLEKSLTTQFTLKDFPRDDKTLVLAVRPLPTNSVKESNSNEFVSDSSPQPQSFSDTTTTLLNNHETSNTLREQDSTQQEQVTSEDSNNLNAHLECPSRLLSKPSNNKAKIHQEQLSDDSDSADTNSQTTTTTRVVNEAMPPISRQNKTQSGALSPGMLTFGMLRNKVFLVLLVGVLAGCLFISRQAAS